MDGSIYTNIDCWNQERAQQNNKRLDRLLLLFERQDRIRASFENRPTGRPTILERARAYVAREPIAVSGQHGHDRTWHVANVLVNGFGLTPEEALEAIRDWNSRCVPPWSEKELQHKLEDALAKNTDPRGYLLNGSTNGHSGSVNGQAEPPPAAIGSDDVATIDDLIRLGAEVRWLWEGWIQRGVLTVIAAEGGTGKTRLCADLLRRIRYGLPWPDGKPMSLAAASLVLWVVSDNHHDEMVTLSQAFGIKDAIRINANKADPYGGVTLDTAEELRDLEARIQAVQPALVIVDTVGNSTDRNLSRQEEAKAYYQPLQLIARRTGTAVLCLTHLNAGGKVLGRRALEKVRVAVQMQQPDPDNPGRRLEVIKSNSKYPAPLGVTMGDSGNDYDTSPPEMASGRTATIPSPAVQECCDWLLGQLGDTPKRVSHLRTLGEQEGFSSKTIYAAKKTLQLEEFEAEGKKWWRVTSKPGEPF